ncbi:hypothetical protein N7447_007778 [Penicillium robsamsonii]|uniref:uncharacterized protein n=1 Tax=Penicillium robsamsonii TaxID=1792511 RepID=UPI0025473D22|nr:uncharacterized protein N7447_007778 [Penicillium robsamsonii]KAJ5817770.1 hypothetical protein N7447_007778 [Penicillium robsamsonii]
MAHLQSKDKDEEEGKAGGQNTARIRGGDRIDYIEPRTGTHKDKSAKPWVDKYNYKYDRNSQFSSDMV